MNIGLQLHPDIDILDERIKEIIDYLISKDTELFVSSDEKKEFCEVNLRNFEKANIANEIDALFSIGGDGTFLGAARLAASTNIPILGIHLGGLGFLAQMSIDNYKEKLDQFFSGDYEIDKRNSLVAEISNSGKSVKHCAFNEFHIDKGNTLSMLSIKTFVDEEHLNTYRSDGLLISTPTGSTAYGLSAGGPIVMPGVNVIIVSPICSHNLSARPVVVSANQKIKIDCSSYNDSEALVIDGQKRVELKNYNEVNIEKSTFALNIVRFKEDFFFETLRSKLNWGLDRRDD